MHIHIHIHMHKHIHIPIPIPIHIPIPIPIPPPPPIPIPIPMHIHRVYIYIYLYRTYTYTYIYISFYDIVCDIVCINVTRSLIICIISWAAIGATSHIGSFMGCSGLTTMVSSAPWLENPMVRWCSHWLAFPSRWHQRSPLRGIQTWHGTRLPT